MISKEINETENRKSTDQQNNTHITKIMNEKGYVTTNPTEMNRTYKGILGKLYQQIRF